MNTQTTNQNTFARNLNLAAIIHDRIAAVSTAQAEVSTIAESILASIDRKSLVLPVEALSRALRELAKAHELAGCMDVAVDTLVTSDMVMIAKRPTLGKLCRQLIAG